MPSPVGYDLRVVPMVGVPIRVTALWDGEAQVWVASSTELPGLVTEAEGLDSLRAKIDDLVPELLEASGQIVPGEITIEIIAPYRRTLSAASGA